VEKVALDRFSSEYFSFILPIIIHLSSGAGTIDQYQATVPRDSVWPHPKYSIN